MELDLEPDTELDLELDLGLDLELELLLLSWRLSCLRSDISVSVSESWEEHSTSSPLNCSASGLEVPPTPFPAIGNGLDLSGSNGCIDIGRPQGSGNAETLTVSLDEAENFPMR